MPRLIAAGVALVMVMFVLAAALAAFSGASPGAVASASLDDHVSALAEREIPAQYLRLYEQAAQRYGLDWAILAGIGKVECDHGRDPDPSCTREGAVNSAGAGGPMQFIASTWARYGVDAASISASPPEGDDDASPEGEGSGKPDRWNPADAIYAAANYLRASGAPADYRRAIFAYNRAEWYVDEVEGWAAKYSSSPGLAGPRSAAAEATLGEGGEGGEEGEEGVEGGEGLEGADASLGGESPTAVRFIPGERARLAPSDGHLALVPAGVPASVQAMVVAGNELQDLPYGPDGHPDPLGASEEDCSSTLNYVLYRAGVRPLAEIIRENPLAQDYVSWGASGPGRWVTIYASAGPTPHAFIVIAGLRLDTSHDGTDMGPNRDENGPRWRILDHVPTWEHWSVRHPPGL